MPRSLEGLLLFAVVVPLVAVGVGMILNWLGILNERMKKRHNVILHLVSGGSYIIFGVVALLVGAKTWFPTFFFVMGTWWVVYGLYLQRVWRERLDEPVGLNWPP